MSSFVAVRSGARFGSVIARSLPGGWVWACRPLPAGGRAAGFSPAPACLFVPFDGLSSASDLAKVLASYGLRVWVRSGSSGSPVFSSCGLVVPALAVKVAVPDDWGCSRLRAFVDSVLSAGVVVTEPVRVSPKLSSLAFAL